MAKKLPSITATNNQDYYLVCHCEDRIHRKEAILSIDKKHWRCDGCGCKNKL